MTADALKKAIAQSPFLKGSGLQLAVGTQQAASSNAADAFTDLVLRGGDSGKGVPFPRSQWGATGVSFAGSRPAVLSGGGMWDDEDESDDDAPDAAAPKAPTPEEKAAAEAAEKERARQEQIVRNKVGFLEEVYRGTANEYSLSDTVKEVLQKIGTELLTKSEDYGVGATLREVAKAVYSRWTVEPQYKDNKPFLLLWNVMEEARTGNMLKSQYPGAKDYFRPVYEEDFLNAQAMQKQQDQIIDIIAQQNKISKEEATKVAQQAGFIQPLPKHIQYAMGVLYEFFSGKKIDWNDASERPNWVADKDVVKALNDTKADYREVTRLKESLFGKKLPEDAVQKQATDAYNIVRDKIWPIYQKLVEDDQQQLSQQMGQDGQQSQQGQQGQQNQQGNQSSGSQSSGSQSSGSQSSGSQSSGSQSSGSQSSGSQSSGSQSSGSQSSGSQSSGSQSSGSQQSGEQQAAGEKEGEQQGNGTQQAQAGKEGEQQQGQAGAEAQKQAKDIIDQIDDQLSRQLETKDESTRRGGDGKAQQGKKGQQGNQSQKGQKGQKGDKGDQASESAEGDGESAEGSQQGQQAGQGKQAGEGQPGGDGSEGAEGADGDSQGQGQQGQGNGRTTSDIERKSIEELMRLKRLQEAEAMRGMSQYQRYYSEVFQGSRELAGILNNIFDKNAKPRYIRGQKSPGVVDMPAVIQQKARASRGEIISEPPIWKKREEPNVRDHGVVFVLDLSGSMSGDKKETAIKAWIMAAEALETNHVPWSLVVFSDDHAILKSFEDTWDDRRRNETLDKIINYRQSGTNDSDAVRPAIDMIEAKNPSGVRLILPITDGEGKEEEMRKLVQEGDKKGISIIGVGIDAAMDYIKKVYIHNAFARNLASLPSVLGSAIQERFRSVYGQR